MSGDRRLRDAHGHVVRPRDDGRKLVDVCKDRLGVVAIREVGELLRRGGVLVDGTPGGINDPARAGTRLTVVAEELAALQEAGRCTPPSSVVVEVVHADDALVVVDKPAGMHVHPLGPHRRDTLVGALLWRAGARPDRPWASWRPRPTHRLDRVTSGLLAVATSPSAQRAVDLAREAGQVERVYAAVVHGSVAEAAGTIELPLGVDPDDDRRRTHRPPSRGGRPAVTHYRVVGRDHDQGAVRTRLELTLETGRTHQVRAHLALLGHPIVGDVTYGAPAPADGPAAVGIALRAVRLVLPHPTTGETLVAHASNGRGLEHLPS